MLTTASEGGSCSPEFTPRTQPQQPKLTALTCSLEEAAQLLSISKRSVQRLIDRGFLTKVPYIRRVLIPRKQIEAFVNKAPAPFAPGL